MKAINYHIKGISKTFTALAQGKYLIYFIPGLVLTILYWFYRYKTSSLAESVVLHSDYSWVDWTLGYVTSGIQKTLSLFDIIVEQIYIFAVLTLLSPFNTALGENFDEELTGFKVKSGFIRFINDFFRMVLVVLMMLFLEFFFMGVYWLLSWIIGGPHDDIVYFVISAFFFGLSFYDFALERYGKGLFSTIGFAFTYPLGMILTGAIFLGLYNLPYSIGIPLAPVLCVMISTVTYAYYEKKLPKSTTSTSPQIDE